MANLMFYQQPVALNKETHKDKKISSQDRTFEFAAGTKSVILAGLEFSEAGKEYPIVFAQAG
ncbi:SapC family protein, partial [Thalassolituus sp.]|uniref:SapC family protein n=1 Tax=Thalassolituus sp. TaxID=2030822 RepID=UPI003513F0BA